MHQGSDFVVLPNRRQRRHFTLEHKLRLVQLCNETGASASAVAQANNLNANLLRRWVHDFESGKLRATPTPSGFMVKSDEPIDSVKGVSETCSAPHPGFIPVRFEAQSSGTQSGSPAAVCGPLDIQVRRGDLVVQIQSKQASLADCAQLLSVLFK